MNEQVARDVVLVRAIELADRKKEILSEDDRLYASRSARELAQWQAADSKSEVTPDQFLQQRADLLLKRVAERSAPFKTFIKRGLGWRGITIGLPLIAFLVGAGLDRIGDPHRVDLLSAPLLGIIGWNLLVYGFMLVWLLLPRADNPAPSPWMQRLTVGKPALPRKLAPVLSAALIDFMAEWGRISRKLTEARLARTLHLAAAMFAAGAVASLLARGLLTQYVAGWESTFLNAAHVHAALSVLFAPVQALLGLQGFTVADIEALRFTNPATPEGGRRWVLLYAATMVLLVVLPRLLLAAIAHFQAHRRATHVAIDLEQPYFRQLRTGMGGPAGVLRVLPYSFTIDEARDRGLAAVAAMLLGENASVMLRPSSAYGDEAAVALADGAAGVTMTAVLFNLAATPENENHGAFIAQLAAATPHVTVLIDESSLAERLGLDGKARVAERAALWQQFCAHYRLTPVLVNLLDPKARPLEGAL
ncbi:DUF2868 domain-containing protein [Massilia sp. DWR3-1-1]|uniref:DUF2868 domain-containing protein n=1 Tax=Massilia sp. DWR3-1-1 TaxID=2804559 RepID=UPI003CF4AFB3